MKIRLFTIPNAITCLNLMSGCLAVDAAFGGDYLRAFIFIAAAAVFDFLDGLAARLLRSYSQVGRELDSLADVVSFGAAPALLLFTLPVMEGAGWWRYGVLIVAAFSALRLAKFNLDERQSSEFIGLPTPACAILTASLCMGGNSVVEWITGHPAAVLVYAAVMSFLLVSEIRMFSFKFKSLSLRGNELRYIFAAFAVAAAAVFGLDAVSIIIAAYIAVSVVRNFSGVTKV